MSNLRKIIVLLFIIFTINCYPQCINSDFSLGDFTNWNGSTGANSAGDYSSIVLGINQGVTNSLPNNFGQQTIINTPGTDPNTGGALSVLPPGGSSCARLGNENTNYGAERLEYVLNVTSANCIFTYQYAVVLEDPNHPIADQPKFTIYVLNSSGNVIDPICGVYEVSAGAGIPGFQNSTHAADGEITRWKNWATVGIDLSLYIGQNITIQFTTYDCAQGAHFGYAYIACTCGSLQLNQQCLGSSVILTAPAGFASYSWNVGGTTQSITITNPVNGTVVTCICTSVQGCTVTLIDTLNIEPVSFTLNIPIICSGEIATLTANGVGSYNYVWSDTQIGSSINVAPTTTTIYSVTATAAGGCSNSLSTTVTVNPIPAGNTQETQETCAGSDGTITVNMTTGTAPYFYDWNTIPQQNTQTANNLPSGNYTVTVTDNNGCTNTINGTITSNLILNVTITFTDEACGQSNGTATVYATGGDGNYTFEWSIIPQQFTQTAINLPANTYTVTVYDGVCSNTAQAIITNLAGPSVSITSFTNTTCGYNNGSASASANGGFPPYTYIWSNSQTGQLLNNVYAGTYSVIVTDSAGCVATNSITLTDLAGPTITTLSTNEICNKANGTATVSTIGGAQPYNYIWSDNQNTQTAIGLAQGNYTVTVTDNNGCTISTSVVVLETNGPTASFTAHPKILTVLDGPVSFTDNSTGNINLWGWLLGDGSTQNLPDFEHQYNGIGNFVVTLIITDVNGCKDTVIDTIKVIDIYTFYIPNVFTPNDDEINDYFFPQGVNVDPNNFDMVIFDRWGNLVFETNVWTGTQSMGWNGTMHNKGTFDDIVMDVYVYKIHTKELFGINHEYRGRITLLP